MRAPEYKGLALELKQAGLFKPRWSYGLLTFVVEASVFALAFWGSLKVAPWSLPYFLLEIFLGLSTFRFFVILHECGHRTLFPSRTVCTIIGTLASMVCMIPFAPWRTIHTQHHTWVGVIDKDPTQKALLQLKDYSAGMNFLFRFVWKMWLPVMYLVFITTVFWTYPVKEWRKGNRKEAVRGLLSVIACAAPRIVLIAIFGWKWALIAFIPMFYVFLFVDENVSLPQHTGLFPFLSHDHPDPIAFHDQDSVTRTTHDPGIFSVLLAYNFNLHTEHHLFPSVPWYWLPRVTKKVETLHTYTRVNFVKYMASIRSQDPVVVYTQALPPHAKPESAPTFTTTTQFAHATKRT